MRIDVLCSDPAHPVMHYLEEWAAARSSAHEVKLLHKASNLRGGDILFLVSAGEIVSATTRAAYRASIVLHASDLPRGRGWSPLVWQVLEGRSTITVTALSAVDKVDCGDIWAQRSFVIEPHELVHEIHAKLFAAELELMDEVVSGLGTMRPRPQEHAGATYFRRRTPEDSRLDAQRSIAEQFDLLRISDPDRYPAYFECRGHRYRIRIEKLT